MLRLFFALWPDDEVRKQIAHQRDLIVRAHGGAPTRTDRFHLTLVFLDGVPEEQLPAFKAFGDGIHTPPFSLRIDARGQFHRDLSYLACTDIPDELALLQRTLQTRAEEIFGDCFREQFNPHITVARKSPHLPPNGPITPAIEWNVDKFVLIHSILDPGKTRYDVLQTWPLDADPT